MKAVIFGANGQDGFYLTQLLRKKNIGVIRISRNGTQIRGDVKDFFFVDGQIRQHRPDYIFHLAANSTTRHDALFDNHEAISTGTLNILESVRRHCPKARVFLSGSALQFKNDGSPIDEQTPFEASSFYSVARIQATYSGRYFRDAFKMRVYTGYFFHHDSPLRSERHVNQKIALAAKRIAAGSCEKLEIGDIRVKKEFTFAGDTVEAVWNLVNQDTVFEAVIGSGQAHSIEEWTGLCFGLIGKDWRDFVTIKPDYTAEYQVLVSNPSLIQSLGWKPETTITELAKMMMD